MTASRYSRIDEHIRQHDLFIEDIKGIFQTCMEENADANSLLDYLKHWWKEHILISDMAFSEPILNYFRSHHRIIKKR
jgi:hemerythrin